MFEFYNHFLLVDDDEPTNVFHKYVLQKAISNANVSVVISGQHALDWLNDSQNSTPTVIFLDINMPLMSGWDFLKKLRQFPKDRLPGRIVVFHSQPSTPAQEAIVNNLDCQIIFHKKPLTLDWINTCIKSVST